MTEPHPPGCDCHDGLHHTRYPSPTCTADHCAQLEVPMIFRTHSPSHCPDRKE